MLEEMFATHSILVKIFLGFLVLGLFIPMITNGKPLKFRKACFIYTMIFQAIITMIAFTGLVAMVTAEASISIGITIMIIIWAILMYIEIKKYRLIKLSQIEDLQIYKVLKSGFIKITIIQILLIALMVILMILKTKGIVGI